jgi:hypothetical protein
MGLLMGLWDVGLFVVACIALGVATAVDPGGFKPTITEPKALKRRRVLGSSAFFLMAVCAALMAITFYPHFVTSWFADCFTVLYAFMALMIWVGILARRRVDPTTPTSS